MKRIVLIATILGLSLGAQAQIEAPVKWSYGAKRISATEAVVFLKATIDNGWHIYSLNGKDGDPKKTSFTFNTSAAYSLKGRTNEPAAITKYDDALKMNESYFEKSVIFQQKIKLKSPNVSVIKGKLRYMTCNDHKCLPPDEIDFIIPLGK